MKTLGMGRKSGRQSKHLRAVEKVESPRANAWLPPAARPPDVKEFAVQHPQFALPAITLPGWSRKERFATVTLVAGETNHASVQVEPLNQAPITHY